MAIRKCRLVLAVCGFENNNSILKDRQGDHLLLGTSVFGRLINGHLCSSYQIGGNGVVMLPIGF